MKMRIFLGLALIAGLMFAGCAKDSGSKGDEIFGDGAIVELKLSNPALTRANLPAEVGTGAENGITNIEIWVFKADGNLSVYKEFTATQANYKFVVPDAGVDMKFLVAINQAIGTVTTHALALEKIAAAPIFTVTTTTAAGNTLTAPADFTFAMAGWAEASVTAATPTTSPVTPVTIDVMRLVSKVEAPTEIAGGAGVTIPVVDLENLFGRDPMLLTDVKFAMNGFVFINGLDKTSVFNNWNVAGTESTDWDANWRLGKTYLASAFNVTGDYEGVYAGVMAADMFIAKGGTEVVYVYENTPKDDSAEPIYFDKTTVYSCVIKGTLTDNGATPTPVVMTRYWKANLIPDDNHKVLRNTIYRMEIQGVNTIGYATPKDAEEEVVPKQGNASVQVGINVAKWRVKFQGTIL